MALKRAVHYYHEYHAHLASIFLVGGFLFDILTLQRVDAFWENFWLFLHLSILAIAILMLNRKNRGAESKLSFWMLNLMQFSFGGLLSAFLIFYFRSSSIAVSWPFLLLLIIIFIANERLKSKYERFAFQMSMLFFSIYLFSIFFVPVALGTLGNAVFLLSGAVSLVVIWLFVKLLEIVSGDKTVHANSTLQILVLSIFAAVNLLYFANVLPPIPLALKSAEIYNSISKGASGEYLASREPRKLLDYFEFRDTVRVKNHKPLYAYTAIFSPTKFSTRIVHEWQRYDERSGQWETEARIPLNVVGGRGEGYRTYSIADVKNGKWRVNVQTPQGQTLGRIGFDVEILDTDPPLQTKAL